MKQRPPGIGGWPASKYQTQPLRGVILTCLSRHPPVLPIHCALPMSWGAGQKSNSVDDLDKFSNAQNTTFPTWIAFMKVLGKNSFFDVFFISLNRRMIRMCIAFHDVTMASMGMAGLSCFRATCNM